jgi:hypothetical protein
MKKPPASFVGSLTALVVAVASLVTVFVHKPPEDAAKAGYIELTTVLIETQAAEKQNHEDVVALRGYLEAYVGGHTSFVTPIPAEAAAATAVAVSPLSSPPPPPIAPRAVPKRVASPDSISW